MTYLIVFPLFRNFHPPHLSSSTWNPLLHGSYPGVELVSGVGSWDVFFHFTWSGRCFLLIFRLWFIGLQVKLKFMHNLIFILNYEIISLLERKYNYFYSCIFRFINKQKNLYLLCIYTRQDAIILVMVHIFLVNIHLYGKCIFFLFHFMKKKKAPKVMQQSLLTPVQYVSLLWPNITLKPLILNASNNLIMCFSCYLHLLCFFALVIC